MRLRVRYLHLEIKKTIKIFPRMLLQAILLMAIIGTIAFCGVKSMEREPLAVNVDIGVVVREDNMMTRMALGYVQNMESVAQICHFIQLSEEDGFRQLERKEIVALIVLPEQLVEGIMNGINPTVNIVFPKDVRLEAMLLRELTESGAGLLRVAQAEIYGAIDTAAEYDLTDQLSVMEAEIDSFNLAFALDRLALYDEETVSVTGRMSLLQYYVSSGVVLFLLLAGMAAYSVMQREPIAFRKQLERQRVGALWQYFCKWLCGLICMGLIAGAAWVLSWVFFRTAMVLATGSAENLVSALVSGRYHISAGIQVGVLLLMLITVTTLVNVIYSVSGNRTVSILLIFIISVILVYLSGGFIPSVLMPQTMQAVGGRLPTAYLIRAFGGLLAGYGDGVLGQCVTGMCIYTVVFGVAGYILGWRK